MDQNSACYSQFTSLDTSLRSHWPPVTLFTRNSKSHDSVHVQNWSHDLIECQQPHHLANLTNILYYPGNLPRHCHAKEFISGPRHLFEYSQFGSVPDLVIFPIPYQEKLNNQFYLSLINYSLLDQPWLPHKFTCPPPPNICLFMFSPSLPITSGPPRKRTTHPIITRLPPLDLYEQYASIPNIGV